MGLIDDKKNVFTTIGAYTSLREVKNLPDTSNLFPSINNKNDITGFLLDILGVVVGTTALQELVGELFTNFINDTEPTIKTSIKKQLIDYNSGDNLPTAFINNGVTVNVKDIDVYGKLKTNPNSDSGNLLYSSNNDNFDQKVYEAIINSGTDISYKNLLINYNSINDTLTFKPTIVSTNKNIGEWLSDFIDGTTFLNKKEFISNVLNNIFGSVSANQNKTIEELTNETEINKILDQIISDGEFTVSEEDYFNLQQKAYELKNGTVFYDMGCGLVEATLPLSGLTDLVSQISGSTDPFAVSNIINNAIGDSFKFNNNEDINDKNNETIRNGFFVKLLNFIKLELIKILTLTPQARMLLAISTSFQNDGIPQISNPKDDFLKFKVYIKCMINDILSLLYKFIFNLIVQYLIELITPIVRQIIREKINQYLEIIRSLISSKL